MDTDYWYGFVGKKTQWTLSAAGRQIYFRLEKAKQSHYHKKFTCCFCFFAGSFTFVQ